DTEVATARQERETALSTARTERERRVIAEQREADALLRAENERKATVAARQAQEEAIADRDAAVVERGTLHATLQTEIADRQRVQMNLDGAIVAKDRIEHDRIALASTAEALRHERDQLRLEAAATLDAHRMEIGRLHTEHHATLTSLRTELEAGLRSERDRYGTELEGLRTQLAEAARAYQQQISQLSRELGGAEARAEGAATARTRLRADLATLLDQHRSATEAEGDLMALRERLDARLAADTAS
ncbi:MAG TPA: hypothetical protein VHU91_07475, partial [Mycobacteriales bacterium]|nr:hypothetical protein [Mycobacteriales bacterium]